MNKKIIVGLIAAMLLIPIIPAALAGPNWIVNTNKKYYQAGETVNITVKGVPGLANITIWKLDVAVLSKTQFTIPSSGIYNKTFTIDIDAEVGLYNIVVESGLASAMTNFFVTKTSGEELAEEYMRVALRAKDLANKTLMELENVTLPPSVIANFEHGLGALDDAQSFIDDEKYEAALGAANRAQVHFMNAVKIAMNTSGDDGEVPEVDALRAKIERGLELIIKLNNTLQDLEGDFNATKIEQISTLLEAANSTLTSALSQVGVNNTKAMELVKEAYVKIKKAQALLKEVTQQQKKEMMERFLEKLQLRLQKIEEAVERIRTRLGLVKTTKIIVALKNRLNAAERLNERLQLGQEAKISEVEALIDGLMDDIDEILTEEYSPLMKKMDKINANLGALNDTLTYGLKKGWDIKELKASVIEAAKQMEEALENMRKGNRETAMDLLEETASDLIGKHFGWIIGRRP